ncbi:unnamed protein product, partial [Didymodactylos carnosus]
MEPKIKVYRGQVMQKDEFKKLFERSKLMFKSDRIVINSLFSTSLNAETPRHFIRQSIVSEYLQKVVFQIDIDVRHQTRPFANVSSLSAFPKEDEILFMVGASFDMEKGDIWYDENEKFWISKLFLRRDNLLKDDRDFEYTTMSYHYASYAKKDYKLALSYYDQALKVWNTYLNDVELNSYIN